MSGLTSRTFHKSNVKKTRQTYKAYWKPTTTQYPECGWYYNGDKFPQIKIYMK